MFSEGFFFGFYWSARHEEPLACATKLKDLVIRLSSVDKRFLSRWQWVEDASVQIGVDSRLGQYESLLKHGMQRSGKTILTDLGYSASLILASSGHEYVLSVNCGATAEYVNNSCTIHPPVSLLNDLGKQALVQIAQSVADVWDPDHGVYSSTAHLEFCDPAEVNAYVGWITYLSDRRKAIPVPNAFSVQQTAHGKLLVMNALSFSARSSRQLLDLRELQKQLRK